MTVLLDTSILIEVERGRFDLRKWGEQNGKPDACICDAGIAEYLSGEPLKDEGKRKRFRQFWDEVVSVLESRPVTRPVCERAGQLIFLARTKGRTVPLGDALHAAVADIGGLAVLTLDAAHFADMGVQTLQP